jgi:hypothetical protein
MATDTLSTAVSTQEPKRTFASRTNLWDDGLVKAYVPRKSRFAKMHYHPKTEAHEELKYIVISHAVVGGNVRIYLHADDPKAYRGKEVLAKIQVWMNKYTDGTRTIHIDLREPEIIKKRDKRATHDFVISPDGKKGLTGFEKGMVFQTPPPLSGAVAVAPI